MRKLVLIALFFVATAIGADQNLTLQECIQIALKNNPDIRLADKMLESAKVGVTGSYSSILPNVSFGTSATHQTQGPSEYVIGGVLTDKAKSSTNLYSTGFSYYQNLYDGGKWWNSIRLAKNSYKGQSFTRDLARQTLIVTVTEKFYSVLQAQELLKVYQKSLENSQEQLKKTEEMHRIGQVAKKDLFKSQVREGSDRLNVIQQESTLKLKIAELKVVLGVSSDQEIQVDESTYQRPQLIDLETAIAKALSQNPEFNSLQTDKQTSFLQYRIAKSSWYPSINSRYSYSRSGSEFSKLYSDIGKWYSSSLNLSLSIPIFDGLSRKTTIQQKKIDYMSCDDKIEKKKLEIRSQIENLVLTMNTYRDMVAINELNIESAREDLRLQQEMYRLNSATLLEVLDAQVALTTAEGKLISIKYDAKIAEARLAYAMGTL